MALKYVQGLTQYLAGNGVVIGATSVTVQSLTDIYANVLTMTDFGTKGYGTLEPDTTNEEGFTFTGIVANANGTYTLTGVYTALAKSPYTETSGLIRQHAGGTKLVISDNAAFWNTFGNKANDETLTGRWGTGVAPLNANDIVNKTYADGIAIAGGANASSSTKGISKLSIDPVSPTNPIAVGDNDTRIGTASQVLAAAGDNTDIAVGSGNKFVTQTGLQKEAEQYAVSTGSANAYIVALSPIPTSYSAGMTIKFTSNFANTGSATVNVNSLGTKTIKKLDGATNLASGDIASGQTVTLVYDGTNFVMQTPVANVLSVNSYFTVAASANLRTSDDTSTGSITNTTYTKVKEILFNEISGTITTKFNIYNEGSGGANLVYGRIYKNGVAYGTEQTTSSASETTFSQDLAFSTGDLIQLYTKSSSSSPQYHADNFRLYYDKTVALIANTVNL